MWEHEQRISEDGSKGRLIDISSMTRIGHYGICSKAGCFVPLLGLVEACF